MELLTKFKMKLLGARGDSGQESVGEDREEPGEAEREREDKYDGEWYDYSWD